MRRLWIPAVVVVLLVGAVLAAALVLVRPDDLRPVLESTLEDALGREVTLGALELRLLPLPALRVAEVRVAGATPEAPPFLLADGVRIRLAILPLLVGRVGLASLDVEKPRLAIPLDARGRPVLPGAKPKSDAPPAAEPAPDDAPDESESAAPGVLIAIDRVRLSDAMVQLGPHRIEALDLEGSVSPGGSASAEFSFDAPGAGRVRGGRARVEDVSAKELAVLLDARLEDGDLAGLARLADLGPGYAGRVDGEIVGLALRGRAVEAGKLVARARDLDVRAAEASLGGALALEAEVGATYALDLTDAELRWRDVTRKPRGMQLSLAGPTPELPLVRAEGTLAIATSSLVLGARRQPYDVWAVDIGHTTLELEPLQPLLGAPLVGKVALQGIHVAYPPGSVAGSARLESVRHPLASGDVTLDGEVQLAGLGAIARPLRIGIGGQTIDAEVEYQPIPERVVAHVFGKRLDVEALAAALTGAKDVAGVLAFDSRLELPSTADDPLAASSGGGRFEIAPGRIRGFSLARQAFGELATLPLLVQALRGRDLSRYEEEEFQSLSADYTLADGFAHTENLRLVYANAVADLHGKIGLADGALDLAGKIEISREVDAELGGKGDRPRVIPIEGVGGTIAEPRVRLDRAAVAAAAQTYLGSERVLEKLDEKLGPGAAEAVEGLLDVLRGQPKKKP